MASYSEMSNHPSLVPLVAGSTKDPNESPTKPISFLSFYRELPI